MLPTATSPFPTNLAQPTPTRKVHPGHQGHYAECMLWMFLGFAFAAPTPPEVREMIDDQLAAFEAADASRAWKHVAPALRTKFQTAEGFWRMVQQGYQPVIAPQQVRYGEFEPFQGEPAQWLELVGRDGRVHHAVYLLEQQDDGSWRTAGCLLFEPEQAQPSS